LPDKEGSVLLPTVDGHRLLADLDFLARFGASAGGGVNRVAYSPEDLEARRWLETQLRGLSLEVTTDQAGNTIGSYPGQNSRLPPIAIGSHTDTVPNGGRYDGALGVVAALACARALHESEVRLQHPLEVINFAAEEATLGGTLGSRAMAGLVEPGILRTRAWDGKELADHLRSAGLDPDSLAQAQRPVGSLACFLELHIEQGNTLDSSGVPLGVVDGIVGIRRYAVRFEGVPNHAGTTPMAERRDALVLAASYVLAVRDIAIAHGIVGTVGNLDVYPGAPSVIPGRVDLSVEIRGLDETRLDAAETALSDTAAAATGEFSLLSSKPVVRSDPRLVEELTTACKELGVEYKRLPSGAGHDAMCVARIAPVAMLFVPSQGGISHSADEYTDPGSCVTGARVLLHALLRIDTLLGLEA
jgi:N-carbamoyl-L-amino-acid hydrolase